MRHHTIVCRLGVQDTCTVTPSRPASHVTDISFIDGHHRLGFGLGQALDQLRELGLAPPERAVDLALLAAVLTAADTRISRDTESHDAWTREIDLHVPVSEPLLWNALSTLIVTALNFLTGDRWGVHFRPRPVALPRLATPPDKLRTANPSCVCLFSGGLDSFIGAIDLLCANEEPLLVSHYWDGITSKHQTYCREMFKRHFPAASIHHIRARIGFPNDTMEASLAENTLRARSFLFFVLAALAASAVGGDVVVHVPENGLISLNVPLDPLRLGALSTRTTHPFYMARIDELFRALGFTIRLQNPYRHKTKGQMVRGCRDRVFLQREAKNTMSCSAPTKNRFAQDETMRQPKHCGRCVPCLIRRAAILEGFAADDTPYQIPDLTARILNTRKAEGGDVRSFQLALPHLAAKPHRARFDIHRPGPLTDYPQDLAAYETVYVEGLQEVGRLLNGVRARPL
jgi:7-cyano-7-deazaguanine synthase in queuosine biosynthesis